MPAPFGEACDLHVHSTASDGEMPPTRLLQYSREKGLRALAICDHDTISGVRALYPASHVDVLSPLVLDDIEVVPGVEINSEWAGNEIHILGYYTPFGQGPFHDLLKRMQLEREERVERMVELLKKLGMEVDPIRVMEISTGESVGRPHVAQAMVEEGYAGSVKEAFELYLGIGKPAYVGREHLAPFQAVKAISAAGGVPVWAHPGTSKSPHLLPGLIEQGLQGIEVFHPDHDLETSRTYLELAVQHNLLATGGSDFHGEGAGEGGDLGSTFVSYRVVESLRALATESSRTN